MASLLDEALVRKLRTLTLSTRGGPLSGVGGDVVGTGRGGNVEFREHRPYTPGDELRYVDWNVYARTGHLHVKEFSREQERRVLLRIDASRSMACGAPSKAAFAVRLAAAIGVTALANDCRVRAGAFAEGTARDGQEQVGERGESDLLRELSSLPEPQGATGLGASLRPLLEPGAPRGEVYLFTDLLDPVDPRKELSALVERGNALTIFATWSLEDLHPPLGGVLRLHDSESGEQRLVSVGPQEKEAYEAAWRTFEEDWEAFFGRHGARLVPVRTDAPLEAVLFEELPRHGVLVSR